jgi:hypothetical protein
MSQRIAAALLSSVRSSDAVHMLSILLSIPGPSSVTSWTRAKRLGAVLLDDFSSMRSVSNDP